MAYRQHGLYSIFASRIWFVWFLFYLLVSIRYILQVLSSDIRSKNFFGIIALLTTTLFVTFKLGSFPIDISGEATQQVAAGLSNWEKNDFGYTGTSFLGNPNKQFLLVSLPSLFWGKSIINYRLGYLLPFLLGIFLFYSGLKLYYSKYGDISIAAGISSLAIIAFPVIPVLIRTFEQITNPISFTLQAIGMFLITKTRLTIINWIALGWILIMLANIYVPALAVWALFLGVLLMMTVFEIIKNKSAYRSILWIGCLILSLSFGIISYHHRTDTKLPNKDLSINEVVEKSRQSLEYFSIHNTDMYNNQVPLIGQIIFLPVVIYLFGSLTYAWGFQHFLLVIWIIATIIFSGLSPGYAKPHISFGIHRSIIVIPFILWGIIDLFSRYDVIFQQKMKIIIFSVIMVFNIYIIHNIYISAVKNFDIRSLLLRETINTASKYHIEPEDEIQLGIYLNSFKTQFLNDHLYFFFPKFTVFPDNQPCLVGFKPNVNMIIYTEGTNCVEELTPLSSKLIYDKYDFDFSNSHYSLNQIIYSAK
ncbi:hypothetical protein FJY90_01330 [Candidatus Gottesmanbacteria bacterium]|nr:hypothetical protein [Candidatus Gottesmanbacteria bacterium]